MSENGNGARHDLPPLDDLQNWVAVVKAIGTNETTARIKAGQQMRAFLAQNGCRMAPEMNGEPWVTDVERTPIDRHRFDYTVTVKARAVPKWIRPA